MRLTALIVFIQLLFLPGCSIIYKFSGWYNKDHAVEKRILELVNEARIKGINCGNKYYKAVQPLAWNKMLAQAALNHSIDMAKNGFLSHKGSDGSDPGERLSRVGYQWVAYGEDIGQGSRTPEEAVRRWLKSDMHCKNIMNPEFKEAGSAHARSSNLRIYWTLVFGSTH
jgi:uncharacterized protein YkwD